MRSEIIMRIRSRLFQLFSIAAIICTTQSVCSQAPLSIKLSADCGKAAGTGVVKAGLPICVLVYLENRSGKTVTSESNDYFKHYVIEIRDNEGLPAPEKKIHREAFSTGLLLPKKPGDSWQEMLHVSRYYEMSRPGTYTIQVERKLPDELGVGTVKSNIVSITVLPADDPPSTQQ
jgi:hypothetical protein